MPLRNILDCSNPPNDERFYVKGYKLTKVDNPSNSKKGVVGIYYKEFLAVYSVKVKNMCECIIFEVSIKNKRGYVVSLYRLPSQTFRHFLINFEQLIGDFRCIL